MFLIWQDTLVSALCSSPFWWLRIVPDLLIRGQYLQLLGLRHGSNTGPTSHIWHFLSTTPGVSEAVAKVKDAAFSSTSIVGAQSFRQSTPGRGQSIRQERHGIVFAVWGCFFKCLSMHGIQNTWPQGPMILAFFSVKHVGHTSSIGCCGDAILRVTLKSER